RSGVERAKENLVSVVVDTEAAQAQKIQTNHGIDVGSERLKIPKVADHRGELGHVDGPKLYVGNFNPVGGDGLIEIEDFPRAARDINPVSQPAIDHTVSYTSI